MIMKRISQILFQLLVFVLVSNVVIGQTKDGSYLQEVKTDVRLPTEAGTNVLQLFKTGKELVAITDKGIFSYQNNKWKVKSRLDALRLATLDSEEKLWILSGQEIKQENGGTSIKLPDSVDKGSVLQLFWEGSKTLFVGTDNGLLTYNGSWQKITLAGGKRINGIVRDANSDVWVATNDGLLYRKNGLWVNMDENLMANGNQAKYFSIATQKERRDILFGGLKIVGCIAGDGDHWIENGASGLPYGPVTLIRETKGTRWYGTARGVIKRDSTWHYYNGKRWLPDNQVNDILLVDDRTTWIATPKGISQIQQVEMTLEDKATVFEERLRARHLRHGLVSRSNFTESGAVSTNYISHTYNDGLWTGIYLAAECFRYASTTDPATKKNAEEAFESLERLEKITGHSGFPARTVVLPGEKMGKGDWRGSTDKKWKWLGETSSDEMVGHFFAYPIFYDLVADSKMKSRVEGLTGRIVDHILDNNFQMADLDGKPTRWGVWNPDSLNNSPNWWYEKGTNSLQILSFLSGGHYVTRQPRSADAVNKLILEHGYSNNIIELKKYGPFDMNFVDNQLAFLPYYVLAKYGQNESLKPYLEKSLNRSWKIVKRDKTPMWNIIASVGLKKDCDLKIAYEQLQAIPMDMIMWTMENSHRWDLVHDPRADRMRKEQAIDPIPVAERGVTKWNINPYQLDMGSDGKEENDGAYFLLAYWMGRYHGYWK